MENTIEKSLLSQVNFALKLAPEQRHSYFQMKHFIVNKEPTHQAKLWQCLRELQSRKDSIESIIFEIEEANDNIALIDIEKEKGTASLNKIVNSYDSYGQDMHTADVLSRLKDKELYVKEWEIKDRQIVRKKKIAEVNLQKLKEKQAYLEQETRFFLDCYKELNKIEPVKDFDDLEAQTQYWNERLGQEVTLRTLLQLPLDAELAKTILSLADEVPIKTKLVNSLKHVSQRLAETQSKYLESQKEKNVQKETE
jgi:hypothetical protein